MVASRSAYGLDAFAEDQTWKRRGLCGLDPDLWFSSDAAGRHLAVHICNRHCPVLAKCAEDLNRLLAGGESPRSQVMAGVPFSADRKKLRIGHATGCKHCRSSDG